jgi:hypothetical protein
VSVTTRVNAALKASAAIVAIVGTRVEPGKLPEASALPAIVFTVAGGSRAGALDGDTGVSSVSVQIDVYALDVLGCTQPPASRRRSGIPTRRAIGSAATTR